MKAVILAGGKGTRLGKLTDAVPKPLMPVGGLPVLEHQVRLLKRYGIEQIIISTRYLAEQIRGFCGDGSRWGVSIAHVTEPDYLGTAGALKHLESSLQEDFLVLYADIMLDMNLARLIAFHREVGGLGTLTLHPNDHPQDSDLVEVDDATRRIVAFHPKPHAAGEYYRNRVNAGVYVFSPEIFRLIPPGVKMDLDRQVLSGAVEKEALFGWNTGEYLKDIGTPDRLAHAEHDFRSGRIQRFNNENKRRAVFLDRDGVLNRQVGLVHRPEQLELLPGVAQAVRRLNQSDYLAIVVTNQPVVARGLATPAEVERIHARLDALLAAEGALVDAIYWCPHHPDRGFPGENGAYKVACCCRKPGTGMIEKAVADFNIELNGSFLVGDSPRDILCGRRAGLTTLGVGTGEGFPSEKEQPDHFFAGLPEVVTYICEGPPAPGRLVREPCFEGRRLMLRT